MSDMKMPDFSDPKVLQGMLKQMRSGMGMPEMPVHPDASLPIGKVIDTVVTETGLDTKVRLYLPEGPGPFPVLFFMHGGGFILGNYEIDAAPAHRISHDAGYAVVSIDYALAPEHPWPAAVNEVYAVIRWAAQNAGRYHFNMDKAAVGGSSAGATLAAAACILAAKNKDITLRYAALVYPPLDLSIDPQEKAVPGSVLTPEISKLFDSLYLGDAANPKDPLVSPGLGDAACFPPVGIFSAEMDPLAKEQQVLANKLIDAKVETLYKKYPGQGHGFFEMGGSAYEDCVAIIVAQLKEIAAR
jgi:acetyl esterase